MMAVIQHAGQKNRAAVTTTVKMRLYQRHAPTMANIFIPNTAVFEHVDNILKEVVA